MLQKAFGDVAISQGRLYEWYGRFKDGRKETTDDARTGRPSTATNQEKVYEVLKLVRENRRVTVREVAEEVEISIGSVSEIMSKFWGSEGSPLCSCQNS